MEKGDNIQAQRSNSSREIETIRQCQVKMIEIKNTVTEMKNALSRP
jgi:hypothetical protein